MNYHKWLESLKVGEEVAYGHYRYHRPEFNFSKIAKISPSGQVITLESGKKFNANGDERITSKYKDHLRQPEEARKSLKLYEAECELNQKRRTLKDQTISKIEDMDIEKLEKLEAFLATL